jgi:hypothetical protein
MIVQGISPLGLMISIGFDFVRIEGSLGILFSFFSGSNFPGFFLQGKFKNFQVNTTASIFKIPREYKCRKHSKRAHPYIFFY